MVLGYSRALVVPFTTTQRVATCLPCHLRGVEAFGGYPHALHYALKANSTFALVQLLHALGSAADANSVWEIDVARRRPGVKPSRRP